MKINFSVLLGGNILFFIYISHKLIMPEFFLRDYHFLLLFVCTTKIDTEKILKICFSNYFRITSFSSVFSIKTHGNDDEGNSSYRTKGTKKAEENVGKKFICFYHLYKFYTHTRSFHSSILNFSCILQSKLCVHSV